MPFDAAVFLDLRTRAKQCTTPEERLELLIEALESEQKREELNFRWWFPAIFYDIDAMPDTEAPSCGTAGCAVGLAAVLWSDFYKEVMNLKGVGGVAEPLTTLLGLDYHQVTQAFLRLDAYTTPAQKTTPQMVAARLRSFQPKKG